MDVVLIFVAGILGYIFGSINVLFAFYKELTADEEEFTKFMLNLLILHEKSKKNHEK